MTETGCKVDSTKDIYFYELEEDGTLLCFDDEEYEIAKIGVHPFTKQPLPRGKYVKINSRNQFRGSNTDIIDKFLSRHQRERFYFPDLNDILKDVRDADPSPNKKYVAWIINSYRLGGIKRSEDMLSRVKPALEDYILLSENNKLDQNEKNINTMCGLVGCQAKKWFKPGLEDLIDKYQGEIDEIRGKKESDVVGKEEGELIYDGETIKIIHPTTEAAACYYGRGTRWCTAATRAENYFEDYNEDGPLYIIIPKNPQYPGEKYQVHFETSSFMNEKDKEISFVESTF